MPCRRLLSLIRLHVMFLKARTSGAVLCVAEFEVGLYHMFHRPDLKAMEVAHNMLLCQSHEEKEYLLNP